MNSWGSLIYIKGVKVSVKGVSVRENTSLEDYALKKAEKFYHHFPEIIKVEIELRTELGRKGKENDFIADINLHIPGKTIKVSDQERDLYKAVDRSVDRMLEVLRREKGKKQGRFRHSLSRLVTKGLGYFPALGKVNKRIFRGR